MNKKPKKNLVYCIAYIVLWVVFRIVMPTRCINKGNRPRGGALLCANHTRTNDPLFIAYALGWRYQILWCSARHTIQRCRRGASPPRRTITLWRMI